MFLTIGRYVNMIQALLQLLFEVSLEQFRGCNSDTDDTLASARSGELAIDAILYCL